MVTAALPRIVKAAQQAHHTLRRRPGQMGQVRSQPYVPERAETTLEIHDEVALICLGSDRVAQAVILAGEFRSRTAQHA